MDIKKLKLCSDWFLCRKRRILIVLEPVTGYAQRAGYFSRDMLLLNSLPDHSCRLPFLLQIKAESGPISSPTEQENCSPEAQPLQSLDWRVEARPCCVSTLVDLDDLKIHVSDAHCNLLHSSSLVSMEYKKCFVTPVVIVPINMSVKKLIMWMLLMLSTSSLYTLLQARPSRYQSRYQASLIVAN